MRAPTLDPDALAARRRRVASRLKELFGHGGAHDPQAYTLDWHDRAGEAPYSEQRRRTAHALRTDAQLSLREISELMNVPYGTVKKDLQIMRLRRKAEQDAAQAEHRAELDL